MDGAVAPLIINHASRDARFSSHPGLELYGIESYIAVPLRRRDGSFFGTLCALDPEPAKLTDEDLVIFELLSGLIAYELEAEEQLSQREEELKEARRAGKLREELLGYLGHDLRNPLNAISASAQLLKLQPMTPEDQASYLDQIVESSERMAGMIRDLLDFTNSRLGNGVPLRRQRASLTQVMEEVLREHRVVYPGRTLVFAAEGPGEGEWDSARAHQVFSNLVGNALKYGHPEHPVEVTLREHPQRVELEVSNRGPTLPEAELEDLFHPFKRMTSPAEGPNQSGLGLGLYIVKQIVQAHEGEVSASSRDGRTVFTTQWPRNQAGEPACPPAP